MYFRFILALFCFVWGSLVAQEVTVELSPETCAPGDEVELIFKMRSEGFAQLAVSVDTPDGLHPVAQETSFVEFDSTTREYLQTVRYLFQPMHSGTFEFQNLQVEVLSQADRTSVNIAPVPLQVNEVSTNDISSDPEPWPQTADLKRHRLLWLLVIPILVAIGILTFRNRSQKEHAPLQEHASRTDHLTSVIVDLKRGHVPVAALHNLLSNPDNKLAKTTIDSIEVALYAEHFERAALIALLEAEVTT